MSQVAAEMPEDSSSLGGGEVPATLPTGDSGIDFDSRDAGDIERMRGLGTGQGSNPGDCRLRLT